MKKPTKKQFKILKYLVEFILREHRQPSLQDFANQFGISREGVRHHLLLLEKKNLIKYSGQGPRNIDIKTDALDLVGVSNKNERR